GFYALASYKAVRLSSLALWPGIRNPGDRFIPLWRVVMYRKGILLVTGLALVVLGAGFMTAQEKTGKGRKREADNSKEEEWLPLGVFAMVQGEQVNSNDVFQLAVNKSGTIRGNYYNALNDIAQPVYGSVDKKTQRAAWTVGDRKEPIYEAGIANLTKSETTMLVHFSKDRTQQWTLIRM